MYIEFDLKYWIEANLAVDNANIMMADAVIQIIYRQNLY